jgi:phage/plasmid-associated DNA primase
MSMVAKEAYDQHIEWRKANGHSTHFTTPQFSDELIKRGYEKRRSAKGMKYFGIGLRAPDYSAKLDDTLLITDALQAAVAGDYARARQLGGQISDVRARSALLVTINRLNGQDEMELVA